MSHLSNNTEIFSENLKDHLKIPRTFVYFQILQRFFSKIFEILQDLSRFSKYFEDSIDFLFF